MYFSFVCILTSKHSEFVDALSISICLVTINILAIIIVVKYLSNMKVNLHCHPCHQNSTKIAIKYEILVIKIVVK